MNTLYNDISTLLTVDIIGNAELSKYYGKLVILKYTRSFRPNDEYIVIAKYTHAQVYQNKTVLFFEYPYDLSKSYTTCREMGLEQENDKIIISEATDIQKTLWEAGKNDFINTI